MATDRAIDRVTDAQIDAVCRRLQGSRREIVNLAHVLKGDSPESRTNAVDDRSHFPRSRIMRALTGQAGRRALGQAAVAMAMSRPGLFWRLTAAAPSLRPLLIRFLAERLLRARGPASTST